MDIERLTQLRELVKKINPYKFNMRQYRSGNDVTSHVCNSVGCIVGYATELDTLKNIEKYRGDFGNINFERWSVDFFKMECSQYIWDYMFSAQWANFDKTNTPQHAIYRITKIIDGYIPTVVKLEFHQEIAIMRESNGRIFEHWKQNKEQVLKNQPISEPIQVIWT